jgi:hypothetical protein
LEAHYAAIPPEFKHWAPLSWEGAPSEPFTAIEQICHIRDIEVDGYHVRFRRMLEEINPTLVSIDSEALANERSYATSSATEAFDVFRKARAETVQLLSGRFDSVPGHQQNQKVTVTDEVAVLTFLASAAGVHGKASP